MANRHVNLRIEEGNFQQGFPVTLTILDEQHNQILVEQGSLPNHSDLFQKYQAWRELYLKWGGASRIDPIDDAPFNVSYFESTVIAAQDLAEALNQWLDSDSFLPLKQRLYQELSPNHAHSFLIQTADLHLQRLPWSSWRVFSDFPVLYWGLAPTSYQVLKIQYPPTSISRINLLAVLADDDQVDTSIDQALLENLSETQVIPLHQPTRQELIDWLWKKQWDILFFAGHSSSASGQGKFTIAQDQWMATSAMQYALQTAARQGLKLAIFNSCDGLAIAQDLVQQHIPFIITMREPVPDKVAQAFLEYFLNAYCRGISLFQAFNEAQKRLEALEDLCPNATWLPVLICNPAVSPPTWNDLLGRSPQKQELKVQTPSHSPSKLRVWLTRQNFSQRPNLLFLISTLCLLLFFRSLGGLQGLELWAFDQLMQLRLPEQSDSRLLMVEIDEAFVQQQNTGYGSISDLDLYQVIQQLTQYQPRIIGLDIYRDHDNLAPELTQTFSNNDQLISVCKSPDVQLDQLGVPPPKGLPINRQGFSDVLEDPDGAVRRQILFMRPSANKTCQTQLSFSSQLAIQFLQKQGIQPKFSNHATPERKHLILGQTSFLPIRHFWGGYHRINLGGNQIMLNYRALKHLNHIAPRVKVEEVLKGQVPESMIRDRLIMIGVTANTTADMWETPYRSGQNHKIPGLFLQAQMVSQLLSAVLDQRPLIHTWPRSIEWLWISGWALVGYVLPQKPSKQWGAFFGLLILLCSTSFLALLGGLWLPLIPCLLGLSATTIYQTKVFSSKSLKN